MNVLSHPGRRDILAEENSIGLLFVFVLREVQLNFLEISFEMSLLYSNTG